MSESDAQSTESLVATENYDAALKKLGSNKPVTMNDLLKTLLPEAVAEKATLPETLPVAKDITPVQRAALVAITEQFGKVVPTERRALVPTEITTIATEKAILKDISQMVKERETSIRTTILNHLDVVAEENGDVTDETPRDSEGHYVLAGEEAIPDTDEVFRREIRNGAPTLDERLLKALAESDDVESFDHKLYLACTTQTRVFDEHKAMSLLKKHPELLEVFAQATRPGSKTAALYVRKQK